MIRKRIAAGILAAAMVVTNIPAVGLGGISALADENAASIGPVRYRAISEMEVSADWKARKDAPLENMLSDAANFALSRYNTGGTPRSSMLEGNNNIYIKLGSAADLSKLVWWTDEDAVSGGYGWNVHNGTVTRLRISVTTEDVNSAEALQSLDDSKWTEQTQGDGKGEADVRFDSSENDNEDEAYVASNTTVAHDIVLSKYFDSVPSNITGVRIEVLNTAGTYTPKTDDTDLKDERDTYINGREIYAYAGDTPLENLTACVDFATENGCGADKLVDGAITTASKMSSLLNTSTNADNSPQKHDYGKYFANNNIYFDIGETKTLGRLTYVPGVQNGSIRRCNIYTSDVTPNSGKAEDIENGDWNLVFSNVPDEPEDGEEEDTSGDWSAYDSTLSAIGNSKIANFNDFTEARYVRIEVINTQTPGRGTENKWINAGRVYIYEAEPVYTGEVENVALGTVAGGSTTIKCYTGNGGVSGTGSNASGPNLIIDGVTENNNYWGGRMQLCGTYDNANYVVLDLGGTVSDLSSIKVTWQAKAWATDYKIETSETCVQDGEISGNITPNDVSSDGWKEVLTVSRPDENNSTNPFIDEWSQDDLKTDKLSRYVRITMLRTNSNGTGLKCGAMREIEIFGIKETGTLATIALESDDPVYKGALRRPSTPTSTRYHIDTDEADPYSGYEWYKDGKKLDKESATFEDGTYKLEVKVATKLLIADLVQATIGGEDAVVAQETEENDNGETVLTVSREYTIESPEEAKAALNKLVNGPYGDGEKDLKAIYETNNRDGKDALIYRISTWNAFADAYEKAQGMLELIPGMPNPEAPDEEVPKVEVWYLKSEYEAASAALEKAAAELRLRGAGTEIDTETDTPDVTVTAPAAGAAPTAARLTNPGEITNEDLALVMERDHDKNYFHVDAAGYIHGRVTAPNTDSKNSVFNISGDTKFLIKFTAKPENIGNERESIIGKFNKGYGMQILPAGGTNNSSNDHDQLIVYGYHNASDWPQTGYLIPNDDWYGQDHEIVAIFNGEYFHLFVDGVAGTEVRTYPSNNEIMKGTLTLDNSATFTVGYNPDPGNNKNPNNVDEDFQGGLKDVEMYIGPNCPQDFTTLTNITAEQFDSALETLLTGKEPDMKLNGDPSKYDVASTTWSVVDGNKEIPMGEGDTFEAYRDYKVTVKVTANDLYYFSGQNGILRTGPNNEDVLADALVDSESEEDIILEYIFRAEGVHPKDQLETYLAGLADTLGVKTESGTLVNEDKETGAKKYTTAAWQTFMAAYETAATAAEAEKKWGAENNTQTFADALSELQSAVTTVQQQTAADHCECTLGTITFNGKSDISLDEAMVKVNLEASAQVDNTNCGMHQNSDPDVVIAYTCPENNDAGATIEENNILTITTEGSVTVTATVQLKDGETVVDEGSATAVFAAASTPADSGSKTELDGAITDLETQLAGLNEADYTADSWKELQDKLADAKELQDKLAAYLEDPENNEKVNKNQVSRAIDDLSIEVLVKKEAPDNGNTNTNTTDPGKVQAKAALQKALTAADAIIAAGKGNYSDVTWKAFEDAYNAAKAGLETADTATLTKLTDALVKAQAALADALTLGAEVTGTAGTYRVTNVANKEVTLIKGKDAKKVTIPATVLVNGVSCKVVGIGNNAFKGAKKLTNVVIGENVTSIGNTAFSGAKKLKKVTIGKAVTTIGKKAFFNCKKLKTVTVKGTAIKKIGTKAFKGTAAKIKVKLPKMKAKQKNKLKALFKKAKISGKATIK